MKQIYQVLIALVATALVIGAIAFVHHVSKLPESVFVQKLSTQQSDFADLDCETFTCALTKLEENTQTFLTSETLWTSERGEVLLSPLTLGATPDTEELTATLSNFTENAGPHTKLRVYLFGGKVKFKLSVDQEQLKAAFADTEIEQGIKNASYAYSNGQVQINSEQIGYGIDQELLAEQIQDYWQDFQSPETATLPLLTADPEIRNADLEPLLTQAQTASALSIELLSEWGTTWDFILADHIQMLLPGEENTFTLDENPFTTYLETELAPDVEKEAEPALIMEDMDGNYLFEGSARFGKSILQDELKISIETAIENSSSETIEIPLETIMPEVTVPESLEKRGVTDLLEFGYTGFSGSPYNRIHNINHGIEIYNGHIVEKGAEFSFVDLLGPVDGAHGWREELVIVGDETKPEYGGGLCQVSSTMYRAALYVGLPISLRKEHSYAVSYYAYPNGYGLDATVYQPWPDLRFINDTPGDILIQGYTDGSLAYFVMYGTNDGRTVQMEGPTYYGYTSPPETVTTYTDELEPGVRELDDHSHTGFQVDWYRTITDGDGTAGEREYIHTYYEARPERWLEGISEEEFEVEEEPN
jgi:vancomycin resistance protein YoaR